MINMGSRTKIEIERSRKMRPIKAFVLLLSMLLAPGFGYALTGLSGQPQIAPGSPGPVVLCMNHKVSGASADVMMSQVYDWVHGGRLGVNFTVTNKTNDNIVIDWGKPLYLPRTANEASGDLKTPFMEAGSPGLYDTVAPGATFSKTLWPSSRESSPWRVENRSVYLGVSGDKGTQHQEEIMLNISGEQRHCSI
jgi:hypothetical protein